MDELLTLLSNQHYITGEILCARLGITRAAVWKRMEKLREEGYSIVAAGKRGYQLASLPDCLLPGYIMQDVRTEWAGRGTLRYERTVTSTNTVLKEMAYAGVPAGSLALCELQTVGKGRLMRSWDACEGENLLQSLLLRPSLPVEQAQLCTLAAATAAAQAIEEIVPGLRTGVKWPNDIVINGKKCVGILSELSADMDGIRFIIMGVGINVNQQSFTGELAAKATSLRLEQQALPEARKDEPLAIDRRALLCAYLTHMEAAMNALEKEGLPGIMGSYKAHSVTLGARVHVLGVDTSFTGMAQDIDETGALLVEDDDGLMHRVLSGDVSVRGVMGYA